MGKSISMMLVYFSIFIFAVCYLIFSTGIAFIVLDKILPQTKTLTDTSFPCAYHDCGCKTAEQCRTNCCCFPKPFKQVTSTSQSDRWKQNGSTTIDISYLSTIRCSGNYPDYTILTKKINQYIPSTIPSVEHINIIDMLTVFQDTIPCSIFQEPPDKVPILSILSIS